MSSKLGKAFLAGSTIAAFSFTTYYGMSLNEKYKSRMSHLMR